MLQTVEDCVEDGARKRRVKVEDCAGGEIGQARILVDKRNFIMQVQPLCALAGAANVCGFGLDANAARVGTNRGEQGDVAQAGAKINQHIGCGERGHFEQSEDVAGRGGLIKDFFGIPGNLSNGGFFELKHSGDQLIKVVVAHAVGAGLVIFHVWQWMDPAKQGIRLRPALNFTADGFVEFAICSFQPGANCSGAPTEFGLDRVSRECRLRVDAWGVDVELVERF